MKTFRNRGKLVFKRTERLDEDQIRSLFGRFFKAVKSQTSGENSASGTIVQEIVAAPAEEVISMEDADEFDAFQDAQACETIFNSLKEPSAPMNIHPLQVISLLKCHGR